MENSITSDLISVFEEDQRKVVFSALSDYLHLGLFTDVSLTCGHEMVRAHKVVLAASSKFFRDAFKHCPSLSTVDLDKELAPHGLALTFNDVQLIIGILYCVGTVEISSQRIESLLLIAQVMGIPSLIAFLKRVRESVIISNTFPHVRDRLVSSSHTGQFSPIKRLVSLHQNTTPSNQALVYLFPPSTSVIVDSQTSLSPMQTSLTPMQTSLTPMQTSFSPTQTSKSSQPSLAFNNSFGGQGSPIDSSIQICQPKSIFGNQDIDQDQQRLILTPPSRSGSRATLASLGSFSLQPIPSPALRENNDTNATTIQIKGVSSVLEGFDPSFLSQFNNLQAAQIDDLENALLPHLHGPSGGGSQGVIGQTSNFGSRSLAMSDVGEKMAKNENPFLPDDNLDDLSDDLADSFQSDEPSKIELTKQELSQLQIVGHNLDNSNKPPPFIDEQIIEMDPERPKGSSTPVLKSTQSINLNLEKGTNNKRIDPLSYKRDESSDDSGEVFSIENGSRSSIRLNIPGTSNSLTLNFSADVIEQMRKNLVIQPSDDVISSTSGHDAKVKSRKDRKKKGRTKSVPKPFSCQLCSKSFPKRKFLEKHSNFHVEENRPCEICGKIFDKKWLLQQHLTVEHGNSDELKCQECEKSFKWPRNLLAHMATAHQRETRYRCRLCPLTFLRKKSYIKHHKGKHSKAPEPWCKFCFEIFESLKQRDDHQCDRVENNGRVIICHRHEPPIVFRHQDDLKAHLKEQHQEVDLPQIQRSCPVCHKKFLLKKNLLTHLKRIHESEGHGAKFKCQMCPKTFYYETDKQAHQNTHTKNKADLFNCEVCSKSYSSQKALKDHNKNVHSEAKEIHSCKVCGKTLSDKYKLKYHMKVHSEQKMFKCGKCFTGFKGRENLRKHLIKFHQEKKDSADKMVLTEEQDGEGDSMERSKVLSFQDL